MARRTRLAITDGALVRTLAISILASIIASSLFLLFFQPLLTFISAIVTGLIGKFYYGFIDALYATANQRPADELIFQMFMLITLGPPLFLFMDIMSTRSSDDRMIDQLDRLVHGSTPPSRQPWQEEAESLLQEMLRIRSKAKSSILCTVLFVFSIVIVTGSYISIRASEAFELRLMALGPIISDQDKNDLLRD